VRSFALVMAWRDSRRGRRRLLLYLSAVSLGVAALVAINSFGQDLTVSIRAQARGLLGADLELQGRAPFSDSVEAVLDSVARMGVRVARVTRFASMVLSRESGHTRLFDVRAVSAGYPFYGAIETQPKGIWTEALAAGHVLVDPALLIHLDARVGDSLDIGEARFLVAGTIASAAGDIGLRTAAGPRVFMPAARLDETKLLRFGSLAQYRAYLELPDERLVQRFLNHNNKLFRAERIGSRTVADQEENFTRVFGRLTRYLGLVGLIALLLGGLGVGSAVSVFVRDKLDGAAVLRCLGARQRTVLAIYLLQAIALGTLGAGVGVLLGVGVQLALPVVLKEFLPLDVSQTLHWGTMLSGLAIGAVTAGLFALLPLLRLRDVSPLRALRRDLDTASPAGRPWRIAVYGALLIGLFQVSFWQSPNRFMAVFFTIAVLVTTFVLWLAARLLMWGTRRFFPKRASYVVRQGVANLFRPQNQTTAVTLAIGFGVFLIATLYVVQQNLVSQMRPDTHADRPNLVMFDIQSDQKDGVLDLARKHRVTPTEVTPLVPARIQAVNGRTLETMRRDSGSRSINRWALQREYRNTYRDTLVGSEKLVAGEWWPHQTVTGGLPLVSVEQELARELHVGVGDRITWNVQGIPMETRIGSLREVTWARFETNFFVVFQPGVLERAPQTFVVLARSDDADARARLQRDVVIAFPNVSALDIALVQEAMDSIISKVTLAIRFMALFSIGSGLVILIGALTASRLQRVREAVLLKTLGASARQIRWILLTEYTAWGSLAALTGVLLAAVAGWALITQVFEMRFALPALPLVGVGAIVCALTALVGFANSRDVLRGTPLGVWRELSD